MDGRRLGGRYRLLERRAIGGMAAVWRGRDERTGRDVAIKLLHPHLAADPDARRRLRREARATETLEHPNVIGVRDVVADRDTPAVIMDYVEGRSLAEHLADVGRLGEDEALRVARDVAAALAAAHGHGIVHRDVKPANILLTPDGTARLGDFGIAALDADMTSLTGDQGVIGTLRYMAPERLLGEAAVPATDVWGLGAVLYEMVAGRPAFEASGGVMGAERTLPDRPDGIGDVTWAAIERTLAQHPADRYPDGGAVAAALAAIGAPGGADRFDDAATTVVPLGTAAPMPPPSAAVGPRARPASGSLRAIDRRRPILAIAALGLGALLLGGALVGLSGAGESLGHVEPTPTATAAPTATELPAAAEDADIDAGRGGGDRGGGGDDTPDKPEKPDKDEDKGDDKGRGNGNGNGGD